MLEKPADLVETDYPLETSEHSVLPAACNEISHIDTNHDVNEEHDVQPSPEYSFFLDSQDISLILAIDKLMAGGNDEHEKADCDSILGTQKEQDEESDEETDKVDLSQPLELEEETESSKYLDIQKPTESSPQNNGDDSWDDLYWYGVENISQISLKAKENSNDDKTVDSCPMYVDGNMDDDIPDKAISSNQPVQNTPKKGVLNTYDISPKRRYQPLKISIQKSPSRLHNSQSERNESNPRSAQGTAGEIDLLKQLQNSAAQITQQIRSPNKSPLLKPDNFLIGNSSSKEKIEKVRKKLGTEMKASGGKKDKVSGKSYKSLRIQLLKKYKSKEEESNNINMFSGLSSEVANNEIVGDSVNFLEERFVVKDTAEIDEGIKRSLLQSSEYQQLLNKSNISDSATNESCSFNSNKTLHDISLNESSLDMSMDLGVMSFYETSCYNFRSNHRGLKIANKNCYEPLHLPPSKEDVINNLDLYGLRKCIKVDPFYGNSNDTSSSKEVGFDLIKISTKHMHFLEEFIGSFSNPLRKIRSDMYNEVLLIKSRKENVKIPTSVLTTRRPVLLTPAKNPPSFKDAKDWIKIKIPNVKLPFEKEKRRKIYIQQGLSCFETESVILSPSVSQELSQLTIVGCTPDVQSPTEIITPEPQNSYLSKEQIVGQEILPSAERNEVNLGSNSTTISSKCATKKMDNHELLPELNVMSNSCALDSVTPDNSGAFKMDLQNLQDAHSASEHKYLTVFELEVHVQTRGDLKPDPEYDSIYGIFYTIVNDVPTNHSKPRQVTGILIYSEDQINLKYGVSYFIQEVHSEIELIYALINLVHQWDPDILIGYEIEMLSWGYLIERGYKLGMNLINELNRLKMPSKRNIDLDAPLHYNDIKITGRIILNMWKLMRHEVALMSYSFENIVYHVLHTRIPSFSFKTLTTWWNNKHQYYRELTIKHYLIRVLGVIQILEQLDLVGRTCELSSLFGIQFYEVFSRGSQFRVESMMLRMAKPMNYVAISPSIQQRAAMKAPECLPLIMEPKSRFYSDPVIVLDFQSLYPSMIIAYNYCFSTCLGKIHHLAKSEYFEFGCADLKVPLKDLLGMKDNIHISPAGIAYVKTNVRVGVLPRMLEEILNTRLLVKQSLKEHKNNKILRKVLDARQLGLKLIANVTYGYTSANFSGRMACVEVADSVVSKGRETLESAINLVNKTKKWGAEVIYGDTDSLFVLCRGKSRQDAFVIGQDIADAVTQMNPHPVKLKLEKVYQPCILQTKKRYVGYMYESIDQEQPIYDAKGIETVRRDGCPAVSKILEKSLKILFETYDVSKVKSYVRRQMVKLISGRLSIQELTFAREYRGMAGYKPGACVPALKLAKEWLAKDRRSEPRVGERVGYIISCGPPGLPLIRLVHSPLEFLNDRTLRINSEYYISKVILPPLDRCFTLLGVDVHSWYSSLPRKEYIYLHGKGSVDGRKGTISQYFSTVNCVVCSTLCTSGVCENCQQNTQLLSVTLACKINKWQRKHSLMTKLCFSCSGGTHGKYCFSLDCPVLYQRMLACYDLGQGEFIRQLQQQYLSEHF